MEQNNVQPQGMNPNSLNTTPAAPIKPVTSGSSTLIRLRTMKDDVADAIKRQNETLVSITLAEEKRKEERRKTAELVQQKSGTPAPLVAPKRIGRFVIVAIIVAVLVGLGFAAKIFWPKLQSAFTSTTTKTPKPATKPEVAIVSKKLVPSLIPADTEHRFITSKETPAQISQAINNDRQTGVAESAIKNLSFESTSPSEATTAPATISINQFFALANISVPNLLSHALENSFMAGLIGEASGVVTPFIILKVSDKDIAVAGMLDLESNISPIFEKIFGTTPEAAGVSKAKFRTVVINGRDARIFEGKSNTIAYAFANPQTIVIAQSKIALEKLLVLAEKK